MADDQVLPMTDPWMQNEDFCWGDESAVDHKYRTGVFHSVLCTGYDQNQLNPSGLNAGYTGEMG